MSLCNFQVELCFSVLPGKSSTCHRCRIHLGWLIPLISGLPCNQGRVNILDVLQANDVLYLKVVFWINPCLSKLMLHWLTEATWFMQVTLKVGVSLLWNIGNIKENILNAFNLWQKVKFEMQGIWHIAEGSGDGRYVSQAPACFTATASCYLQWSYILQT